MALGLTEPLTEMSTRNISWGVNAADAYGWQPYLHNVPTVMKSGNLNLLELSGTVQACNGTALPLQQYILYVFNHGVSYKYFAYPHSSTFHILSMFTTELLQ